MEGELVVTLTGMDRSGAAVATVGDQRLVVPGGIPGESVRVRRLRPVGRPAPDPEGRRGIVLAEIVAVEEASPNRVAPRCRHASECGGCAWQHIAYPEQLRRKTAALDVRAAPRDGRAARRAVSPAIGMPPGSDGMPWRFRQKAAFVFANGPRGLVDGPLRARARTTWCPIEECPVHSARANRIAFALRDALAGAGIPAAGVGTQGLARHVVVRTSRDEREAVAMLVATRDDPSLAAPMRALLDGAEKPEGLVLNLHDRPGPYLVGRESKRVAGPGHVKETALGPAFLVSPAVLLPDERRRRRGRSSGSWSRPCPARPASGSSTSTAAAGSSPCRSPCAATRSSPSRRAARARATPSSTAARTAWARTG